MYNETMHSAACQPVMDKEGYGVPVSQDLHWQAVSEDFGWAWDSFFTCLFEDEIITSLVPPLFLPHSPNYKYERAYSGGLEKYNDSKCKGEGIVPVI